MVFFRLSTQFWAGKPLIDHPPVNLCVYVRIATNGVGDIYQGHSRAVFDKRDHRESFG